MIEINQKTVLIIDDEDLVLDALAMVLGRNGFEVTTVNTAQQALILCQKNTFELILTDIVMPDMDGLMLIQTLRECGNTTPIIALTGGVRMGQKNMSRMAVQLGAQKSLRKPITKIELLDAIAEIFNL
jgi:two-component system, chemotaxis family, chemotaxis protein CheY